MSSQLLPFATRSDTGAAGMLPGTRLVNLYVEALPADASAAVALKSCPGLAEAFSLAGAGNIIAMLPVPLWDSLSPGIDDSAKERKKDRFRLLIVCDNGYCAAPEVEARDGGICLSATESMPAGAPVQGRRWIQGAQNTEAAPGVDAYGPYAVSPGHCYEVEAAGDDTDAHEVAFFYDRFGAYVGTAGDGTKNPLFVVAPENAAQMGVNVNAGVAIGIRRPALHDSFTMDVNGHPSTARIAHNGRDAVIATDAGTYKWEVHHNSNAAQGFAVLPTPHSVDFQDVAWQDGYLLYCEANGRWGHSQLDSLSFDPLDSGRAEANTDGLVGMASWNGRVLLFGPESIEVWVNQPSGPHFVFQRQWAETESTGCRSRDSIRKSEDGVYFAGGDGRIHLFGHNGRRGISTPSVEHDLARCNPALTKAYYTQEEGHFFYFLRLEADSAVFLDADGETTSKRRWCHDLRTSLWHERDIDLHAHTELFGRNFLGGAGRVFSVARGHCLDENGRDLMLDAVGPTLHAFRDRTAILRFQIRLVSEDGKYRDYTHTDKVAFRIKRPETRWQTLDRAMMRGVRVAQPRELWRWNIPSMFREGNPRITFPLKSPIHVTGVQVSVNLWVEGIGQARRPNEPQVGH